MYDESDKRFDDLLLRIPHYQRYPVMLPYVGPGYSASHHRRMLLIGESNYLPETSEIHRDANSWYRGNQSNLNEEEAGWISCRGILQCDWTPSGHQIYRELNRCLDLLELPHEHRSMSNVAFMNAFQRPADCGESIKWLAVEQDFDVGKEVISSVAKAIEPDIICFVSKYAWDNIGAFTKEMHVGPKYSFVYYPAQFWWNRKDSEHGQKKFMRLLREHFVKTTED